ncbi:MAG: hypothetical protein J6562_05035 [Candidatus Schmidhempelia sp.]|nr:hypothetical protein [Candidatus Schmidhempelia sp.]
MQIKPKAIIDLLLTFLFELGGIWAAIVAPIVTVIVGFLLPFADAATLTHLLRISSTLFFKIFMLAMIVLPIWYGLPILLQTLNKFNIYPKRAKLLFYGLAFAWSAHAGYIIFIMGNN